MSAAFETVIGLETHVQLITQSKMFCGCSADYDGADPNTLVCPVCLGLPGSLPVPNARAVELIVRTGQALGCEIAINSHFDRKNYHYPDLPKGYQITQSDEPIAHDGQFRFADEAGEVREVRIERVHLEEDTAKLVHLGDVSLVDFNRAGVPLMEIVTHPDMRSPEEAKDYLEGLRQLLRWLGVSTGNMEAGALRADVNVSVRPAGSEALGVKVEVKNLNSFAAAKAALEYEVDRHVELVSSGQVVDQETRGWSDVESRTLPQRSKEHAHDYRYLPEPDLPPLTLDPAWVGDLQSQLEELPLARRQRFSEMGLGVVEARLLSRNRATADYFEFAASAYSGKPSLAAAWITGPLFGLARGASDDMSAAAGRVPPQALVELIDIVDAETLTQSAGKEVLASMYEAQTSAAAIVERDGLGQISDADALSRVVTQVLSDNDKAVADFCGGKDTAIGYLVGRVMRETRGQANPNLARDLLVDALRKVCEERMTTEA